MIILFLDSDVLLKPFLVHEHSKPWTMWTFTGYNWHLTTGNNCKVTVWLCSFTDGRLLISSGTDRQIEKVAMIIHDAQNIVKHSNSNKFLLSSLVVVVRLKLIKIEYQSAYCKFLCSSSESKTSRRGSTRNAESSQTAHICLTPDEPFSSNCQEPQPFFGPHCHSHQNFISATAETQTEFLI